jgi:flagellin-like protein
MRLSRLSDDDRAASSVIGVVLMVAIVVLLASVVGAFVFAQGDEAKQEGPTASFEFTASENFSDGVAGDPAPDQGIRITHESGDTLDRSRVQILVDGKEMLNDSGGIDSGAYGGIPGILPPGVGNASAPSDPWTSGGTYTIVQNDVAPGASDWIEDGDTVRVVYRDPDSGDSFVLMEREISF